MPTYNIHHTHVLDKESTCSYCVVFFRNVSHLAQAQATPLIKTGFTNNKVQGGGDTCPRCHNKVYFAEKVIGAGQVRCFVFVNCNQNNTNTECIFINLITLSTFNLMVSQY